MKIIKNLNYYDWFKIPGKAKVLVDVGGEIDQEKIALIEKLLAMQKGPPIDFLKLALEESEVADVPPADEVLPEDTTGVQEVADIPDRPISEGSGYAHTQPFFVARGNAQQIRWGETSLSEAGRMWLQIDILPLTLNSLLEQELVFEFLPFVRYFSSLEVNISPEQDLVPIFEIKDVNVGVFSDNVNLSFNIFSEGFTEGNIEAIGEHVFISSVTAIEQSFASIVNPEVTSVDNGITISLVEEENEIDLENGDNLLGLQWEQNASTELIAEFEISSYEEDDNSAVNLNIFEDGLVELVQEMEGLSAFDVIEQGQHLLISFIYTAAYEHGNVGRGRVNIHVFSHKDRGNEDLLSDMFIRSEDADEVFAEEANNGAVNVAAVHVVDSQGGVGLETVLDAGMIIDVGVGG